MLEKSDLIRCAWMAALVWACSAGVAIAQSVPEPTVAWTSSNEYVIDYPACGECFEDGIEEYREDAQRWEYVGSGPQQFGPRPAGTYRYRVGYAYEWFPGYYELVYSEPVSVVVNGDQDNPVIETASLADQFDAEYSVRSGDIEGDGDRDLLIRRIRSGSEWGSGPLSDVLLRQDSSGGLSASIPSAYQLALAESWAVVPIELRKRDLNFDGYVDLVLRGVAATEGFSGVANQILFAPGDKVAGQPGLRPADTRLATFSRDVNRHLIDPEYYPNNVPYSYALIVYYSADCGWYGQYGYQDYYPTQFCFFEPQVFVVAYQDFSGFDSDAMAVAETDYGMIHGAEPLDQGLATISSIIGTLLDVPLPEAGAEVLIGGEGAEADAFVRRGVALFSALAGISEAVAQEADNGAGVPGNERVLLKGRRVLGQGPFHTALEFRYSTISAYDTNPNLLFDGWLFSEVDWPRDHPSRTLRLGYVDGPGLPATYWQDLIAADSRYDDDLRYDLFPSLGEAGYNSNSYASGLIQATGGLSTVQMASLVGGEHPVPAAEFN
ncbi:MAG TPA: hypothetical protein VIV64_00290 [Gammaproteobacteria bacterium]|jgi:hypothetical protein